MSDRASRGRVTVVVLSYNRPELLQGALSSIARQTERGLDVLVVDNASPSSARVREVVSGFPEVRLIANATNTGFTGGMNQGIAAADGEYVYLTEDDIELGEGCIAALVDYLDAHPAVALAGPVMWNRAGRTIRCAGGTFTLGSVYRMRIHGVGDTELSETTPFQTMYLPGAMIAARTAVLRELGGFHPDFFMYGEDVELCARALERGHQIAIVPTAHVYHHEPSSQPESRTIRYHKQKNLAALYLLHAPLRVLPAFFFRYVLVDGAKRLIRNSATMPIWLAAWAVSLARAPKLLAHRSRRPEAVK
jgi:GT2 family glycosyltransferase